MVIWVLNWFIKKYYLCIKFYFEVYILIGDFFDSYFVLMFDVWEIFIYKKGGG